MFDVWKNVLENLKSQIPTGTFTTYLSKTTLVSSENGKIEVGVPNGFMQKNVQKLFDSKIRAALKNNNIKVDTVDYVIVSTSTKVKKAAREIDRNAPMSRISPSRKFEKIDETNLSNRYTMDNFVVGSNNEVAVSIARDIIKNPGKHHNPFFLYGGPGLGKTHLVQAIGNAIHEKNPNLKVLYTPIHHFYSEYVEATRHEKIDAFKKKYKNLDVFIVDDFQQIIGKDKSQIEFFDIFNDMYQLGKQVIVTSDRLPREIETVDERLASRLTGEGYFDIHIPNFEERCAILKSKAEFDGKFIEDEAIEWIAENIKTNIRDLQGEYERLITIADLKNVTPLAIINNGYVQTNPAGTNNKNITPKRIIEKVAKVYGISTEDITGGCRVSNIKTARQICMFLMIEELHLSTTKTAREVGLKDHTSVMHGVRKIRNDLKLDFGLRDKLTEIRNKIYK